MSAGPARNGAGASQAGQDDEICPVCKSSRYLNPNMRFLVNPECYHKMCESCVDRIFSQGPAPCPIAGCARTLRKQRFRKQTFEDLQIEREVDVRRRVAAMFNRQQDEFTSLLAFNNYLEEVETLTFNLIYGIDVPTTEAKLAAYASQNAPVIAANARNSAHDTAAAKAELAGTKEPARLRQEGARQQDQDERAERAEKGREIQDRVAARVSTETAKATTAKVVLKKSTARRGAGGGANANASTSAADDSATANAATAAPLYQIQGLKTIVMAEPEKVYDPFGGLEMTWIYHDAAKTDYEHQWLDKARTDAMITTGGYDVRDYCARATLEAFEGLGVIVEEEVRERDSGGDGGEEERREVATVSAAVAAGGGGDGTDDDDDDDGDDVF